MLKTFELKNRNFCLVSSISIQIEFSALQPVVKMKANEAGNSICLHAADISSEIKVLSIITGDVYSYDCGKIIKSFFWDTKSPKVFICELENAEILSFFSTSNQLIIKDTQTIPENCQHVLGISLPFIIYKRVLLFLIEIRFQD